MKPEIPRIDNRIYHETNNLTEVNDLIRSGEWNLYRTELEATEKRKVATYTLVSRQP